MSVERVKNYFKQYDMDERIREFDQSSATVALAAEALGVDAARIAKTLSFSVSDGCVLVVCAGDVKIDNPKFKAEFSAKAKMLPHEVVSEMTGHAVGGVCPFAVNEGVRVFLDESLKRFETVFPAAGSGNSAIEMTLRELEMHSGCEKWVDVCKK